MIFYAFLSTDFHGYFFLTVMFITCHKLESLSGSNATAIDDRGVTRAIMMPGAVQSNATLSQRARALLLCALGISPVHFLIDLLVVLTSAHTAFISSKSKQLNAQGREY